MTAVPEAFWEALAAAGRGVLALDYDGTLAPFRAERDEAVPYPGVREALVRIEAVGRTRLVVISGRPVAEVLALLALVPAPEVWGAHGWEWRPRGGAETVVYALEPRVAAGLARAWRTVRDRDWTARAERKAASVAVHWRDAADAEAFREAARDALAPLAAIAGLELLDFAAGLELRASARDKGRALAEVLATETADVPVAYLGDDATDEDAFAVLAGGDPGAGRLGVLVAAEPRTTRADCLLVPPDQLLAFLDRWAEATGRTEERI